MPAVKAPLAADKVKLAATAGVTVILKALLVKVPSFPVTEAPSTLTKLIKAPTLDIPLAKVIVVFAPKFLAVPTLLVTVGL